MNQSNGRVETNKFHMFSNWKTEYTMEKILIGLKNEMIANKKASQPPDGDMFWLFLKNKLLTYLILFSLYILIKYNPYSNGIWTLTNLEKLIDKE